MKNIANHAPATATAKATNDLRHSITVESGNEKTVIKFRLNDECGNGHEDFSLTADIYERRTPTSPWRESGGGCCHEHILTLRPLLPAHIARGLRAFTALHLSDSEGCPMHAASNAFYWFAGARPDGAGQQYHGGSGASGKTPDECKRIFLEHIRGNEDDFAKIAAFGPRTAEEMSYCLEDLGFRHQWRLEAQAAIRDLEKWTGQTFQSHATRSQWPALAPEAKALLLQRRAEGYYTPEAIAARDAAAKAAKADKARAEIHAEFTAKVTKATKQRDIALFLLDRGVSGDNIIFYDHTNELAFNWSSCARLWTREEFEAFSRTVSASDLPEGVVLRFQERPKY
jgi:hypothetical protein